MVKNPPANVRDLRDVGSIPGSGRSPGRGHGNSLQSSCLENPMDRGAWKATVHKVAESQTQLKRLNTHASRTEVLWPVVFTYVYRAQQNSFFKKIPKQKGIQPSYWELVPSACHVTGSLEGLVRSLFPSK